MAEFQFTPSNLIENIDKLGALSAYGLASIALEYYFPEEIEEESISTEKQIELLEKLGCDTWQDVIIKYQNEIGYDAPNGFNPVCVNDR